HLRRRRGGLDRGRGAGRAGRDRRRASGGRAGALHHRQPRACARADCIMSAPTVLERIVAETREEVQRRKHDAPLQPAPETPGRGRFRDALAREGIGVIAEFKRRSPSAGDLADSPDLRDTVRAYEAGGAVALSILTEGPNFSGSLDDLRAAREA